MEVGGEVGVEGVGGEGGGEGVGGVVGGGAVGGITEEENISEERTCSEFLQNHNLITSP